MAISREIVQKTAHLSRIALEEHELDKFARQLQAILSFIDTLSKVDVSSVSPTSYILPINNVLRDDLPGESLPIDKTLANAPKKDGRFFGVPKVIE